MWWFGSLYILSFLIGVFTIWKLGRDEYFDEDKLIDLSLFSGALALISSRAAFFAFPKGQAILPTYLEQSNVWVSVGLLIQLDQVIWWIGVLVYLLVSYLLLRWWRWPIWPVFGFAILGGAVGLGLGLLIVWSIDRQLSVLVASVDLFLFAFLMYYLTKLKGGRFVVNFMRGFGEGFRQRFRRKKVE